MSPETIPNKTTPRINLVVVVSGSGSNLQALIDHQAHLGIRIQGVISNCPDSYALQRAQAAQITTRCLDHRQYSNRMEFDTALQHAIELFKPDLVVLAGFMRILTPEFTTHFTGRLINIHPSLLPRHKGLHTHAKVLASGDAYHGCSVHFVNAALDGGPIIAQARFPIKGEDTPESLQYKVQQLEHQLYPMVVGWFAAQRLIMAHHHVCLDGKPLGVSGQLYTVSADTVENGPPILSLI